MPLGIDQQGFPQYTFSIEDVDFLLQLYWRLFPSQSPAARANDMLTLDTVELVQRYHESGVLDDRIPYAPLATRKDLARKGWLQLKWSDDPFLLPVALTGHRERMVAEFKQRGRLRVRRESGATENQDCPRVIGFDPAHHILHLQSAEYFDQVATNLCLDFPVDLGSDTEGRTYSSTIRDLERDYISSGRLLQHKPLLGARLRPFEESILANTLGVACLIEFADGRVIYRIRGAGTAIYGGQAHVPLSFAQELLRGQDEPRTLEGFVMTDLRLEFEQETGLEFNAYMREEKPVTPLALCRDLLRGGKPQLFLLLHSHCDAEEFCEHLKKAPPRAHREFEKKVAPLSLSAVDNLKDISTELACAAHLLIRERHAANR